MANNRDLLKEAIADAKAVKETAIANAKAALEEAFAPRLTSMLSAKLEEMEDMDEGYDEVDEMKDSKEMDEGYGKEMDEAKDEMTEAEDMDEEMDLDEILAELEEGKDKEDMKEAEEMDEAKDEMDEAEDMDEAEEDEVEVDAEEEIEGEDEDEEIDLEEMSEDDLKSFIEDVIADMVEAGELEAGEEFDAEEEDMGDMADAEGEEEIEIEDEAEPMMEGEKEDMDEGYGKEDMDEGVMDKLKKLYNDKKLLSKIVTVDGEDVSIKDLLSLAGSGATAGMAKSGSGKTSSIGEDARTDAEEEGYLDGMKDEKEDMDEMKKELNELRSELHEVNLLNAKLLYVNKIFRSKNLTESQKSKVLAAFDKAGSVNEVKLVFETITESVTAKKKVVKESLGRASKAAGVAPTRQPIVEVDSQVARWQKLAGIK